MHFILGKLLYTLEFISVLLDYFIEVNLTSRFEWNLKQLDNMSKCHGESWPEKIGGWGWGGAGRTGDNACLGNLLNSLEFTSWLLDYFIEFNFTSRFEWNFKKLDSMSKCHGESLHDWMVETIGKIVYVPHKSGYLCLYSYSIPFILNLQKDAYPMVLNFQGPIGKIMTTDIFWVGHFHTISFLHSHTSKPLTRGVYTKSLEILESIYANILFIGLCMQFIYLLRVDVQMSVFIFELGSQIL